MTRETLLLVGRDAADAGEVYGTHADRLADQLNIDEVRAATYETEPVRELREEFAALNAADVYAVPMTVAHTYDTVDGVPAALSYVPGEVHYCEPLGGNPAVTEVLTERAAAHVPATEDATLVLAAFGSSAKPYHRQTTEYHAARIREQSDYGEVLSCYLLQNPTVECVRYNVSTDRAVAVPLFLTRTEATEEEIPTKLELDRGGIEYADPLGEHRRVTDAIHAEFEKQRVLACDADSDAFEAQLTRDRHPVAADGEGIPPNPDP